MYSQRSNSLQSDHEGRDEHESSTLPEATTYPDLNLNLPNNSPSLNAINSNDLPLINQNQDDINNLSYDNLHSQLTNLNVLVPDHAEIELTFYRSNVNVYVITKENLTIKFERLEDVKVISVNEIGGASVAYIKIGDWIHVLDAKSLTCYRSDYRTFLFPVDTQNDLFEDALGIVFECTNDGNEFYEALNVFLYDKIYERGRTPSLSTADKISTGLVTGAGYLEKALVTTASLTGKALDIGTHKLVNYMHPNEQPATISAKVASGVEIAKNVSGSAAYYSEMVANKAGEVTGSIASYVAPHIKQQGSNLIRKGFNVDNECADAKMDSVLTVAGGAFNGVCTIFNGVTQSVSILGGSLKNNTVKVVEHKYGESAKCVADDSLSAMGNVYATSRNVRIFKPKNMAKNFAKATGQAIFTDRNRVMSLDQIDLSGIKRVSDSIVTYPTLAMYLSNSNNAEVCDLVRNQVSTSLIDVD